MTSIYRRRLIVTGVVSMCVLAAAVVVNRPGLPFTLPALKQPMSADTAMSPATVTLRTLSVKGRAPKTDYSRAQFGAGWSTLEGCDTRNIILKRDLVGVTSDAQCHVTSGTLNDSYTGKVISFVRGTATSEAVQIDHVVALSDAWQKGAQQLAADRRVELANDPLELLAADGPTNQQKSDGDAATWLPPNIAFRCQYVARQIAVKQKYDLWVTKAEHDAIQTILQSCPGQTLPKA